MCLHSSKDVVVSIKLDIEKVLLGIFFIVFMLMGPGILLGHSAQHPFPYGYFASDSFQHQVRAEAIKNAGNFKYEAPYISHGFENIIGRYPPALYHIAVLLSHTSGLEAYDAIYFIVAFFAVLASFMMYYIIKQYNKTVALLSLPISLILFAHPLATGFLWGHWPAVMAQCLLVGMFWLASRFELKGLFVLLGLSLASVALTHTSEAIFGVLFLAVFIGIKLLTKKLSMHEFKSWVFAAGIFFISSLYYLIIFQNTWAQGDPFHFWSMPIWEGNPGFYLTGFGLLLAIMAVGLIVSIMKIKENRVAVTIGLVMLIAGFLNYVGFSFRSFQIRFFWPLYLSIFVGLGLYILLKFVIKNWKPWHTIGVFAILLVLFSGAISLPMIAQTSTHAVPSIPQLNRESNQGIMNEFHWQALTWLADNTPESASLYFFYGDLYQQDALLRNAERFHAQIRPEGLVEALQVREIRKEYNTEFPADTGGGVSTREGLFSFTMVHDTIPDEQFNGPKNICTFDYWIFDQVSGQEAFAQYNMIVARELAERGAEVVFNNNVVLVMRNTLGEDCIEEKTF